MTHRPHTGILKTLLGLAIFLAPATLLAQRVYWDPPGGTLGVGKTADLSLVFENAAPEGDIALPTVPGLDFGIPSVSRQTSIINLKTTSRVTYTYTVRPMQKGRIVIPRFIVQTDEGPMTVPSVAFDVGEASVGQTGLPIEELVQSQLTASTEIAWLGEIVDLDYLLVSTPRYNSSLGSDPIWNPSGIIAEPFGKPQQVEVRQGGLRRPAVRYTTRMIPTSPGRLELPPVRQRINIQTGTRGSFFFSQPQIEEFLITSSSPTIDVRPLPEPAPEDFLGAVGQFTLESRIVPENASVGEPITWTLVLKGTGNWPMGLRLPQRSVSADFEVVQPDPREEIEDGQMFTGSLTEDAVLVPTKPGIYELGPISFSFFDPKAGVYRTEFIDARTVTIQPAANRSPLSPPPTAAAPDAPGRDTGTAAPPAEPPAATTTAEPPLPDDLPAPAPLPRDPLPEGRTGLIPFHLPAAWWFLVAFIPPALTWLGLAFRVSRREDLTRIRARARREMLALLDRMHAGGRTPTAAELAQWRRLTRTLWRIPRAEPTRADIARAVTEAGGKHALAWAELWREADSALYGSDGELPEDWTLRALKAAREARIVRDRPGFPHRLRHWAPRLTAPLLVLILLCPSSGNAAEADARTLYREGKFAEARAAWLAALAQSNRDWALHNNIALTYAQEERWPEAAAHWTSALLLNPREPAIRANLRLALLHLDGVDSELRRLFSDRLADRGMRLLSPAGWQVLFLIGAGIVAAGLGGIIVGLFFEPGRRWRRSGAALAAAGVLLSGTATWAGDRFGPLASPDAGMIVTPTELHSIPSDLAENQQKTLLPPGSIIVMDRTFLGWQRVQAGGGSVGWVRRETIIPFYRLPHVKPGSAA
ncbi:MAG: protein BatD, partial [Verrucomicrobia bacterium]